MKNEIYDFDTVYSRKNTNSAKWDALEKLYKNQDLIPMWVADMDFKSPQAIIDAISTPAHSGFYGYPLQDQTESKTYVQSWLKTENNWSVEEQEIFFIQSVVKGLSILVRSLTTENDGVLIHTPCYHPFEDIILDTKRKLVKSALLETDTGYQIDFLDFENKIIENKIKATILCNPHNPTGRVWSEAELVKLIEICEKHQVLIISDDIHSDLLMPESTYHPMPTLTSTYKDNIVVLKSISKTFNVAGIHMGYFLTSSKTHQTTITDFLQYTHDNFYPNIFAAPVLKAAYTQGKPWLTALKSYLYDNFQYVKTRMNSEVPDIIVHNLEATYLVWINANSLNVTEENLRNTLDEAGVGIETTSDFGITEGLYIRLNIACPKELLQKGLDALIKGIKLCQN